MTQGVILWKPSEGGGGRVLYLYVEIHLRVFFLAVFPKNEQPDFTAAGYRALKTLVQQLKRES
jgi:hypothetical protein